MSVRTVLPNFRHFTIAGGLSGPYYSIFGMFLLLADWEAVIPLHLA
jgi:hypothetical protein